MSVTCMDALDFADTLQDGSVHLVATDPPYFGIVEDSWDNQWRSEEHYAQWLCDVFWAYHRKLTPDGSLVFFGGIGKHSHRPLLRLVDYLENDDKGRYQFRNWITWKKRRAYGKSHDYLFCREEILWYSKSRERTEVRFNIPLTDEKRGYAGFNPDYPAKSEYKRVSNVWDDIPELMRPERNCQKPLPLMERIIKTHSNEKDLVVDMFCGWGSTGVAANRCGRNFLGCEAIESDARLANARVEAETTK